MPVCPNCGARNPRENTVCRSCGALLELEGAAAKPVAREEKLAQAGQPEGSVMTESRAPSPSQETQSLPIGRAALFGAGAAIATGVIWYLLEQQWPGSVALVAFVAGWLIATAVVFGAGRKQGRQLQWISVGLTLLTILGVQFFVRQGWNNPAFLAEFWDKIQQDLLSLMFYLLGLWIAYTTPGQRRRPQQQQQAGAPEGETTAREGQAAGGASGEIVPADREAAAEGAGLRCSNCKGPTTPAEAYVLPGRRGDIALCPKCVGEIEERFAAEQRDLQINRAVLWGVGAALACGVAWFLVEFYSGWPLAFLAFVGGWIIAEAVRRGAGNKRGRTLQLIAVGLTVLLILGTQVALAVTKIHPVDDNHPVWSPDGKIVAFQSLRSGRPEIYSINLENRDWGQLATDTLTETNPAWAPAGGMIAFQSDREGNSEIYVMNADGTDITRLTKDPANDGNPAWSPDGTLIAFQSDRDGNDEIYLMKADGTVIQRLTDNPAADSSPAWSPDSKSIAFVSDRDGNPEIYVMNAADGGNIVRLTDNPAHDGAPAWSPDGKSMAFQSDREGNLEIYVMNAADGSSVTNLTKNPAADEFPSWRPDESNYIAFQSDRDGNDEIYAIKADGTGEARLTNDATNLLQALVGRVSDLFTPLLFLLGLWQAYNTPAPRRLPKPRPKTSAQT
jgi:Tol biopolymer transport system component